MPTACWNTYTAGLGKKEQALLVDLLRRVAHNLEPPR